MASNAFLSMLSSLLIITAAQTLPLTVEEPTGWKLGEKMSSFWVLRKDPETRISVKGFDEFILEVILGTQRSGKISS